MDKSTQSPSRAQAQGNNVVPFLRDPEAAAARRAAEQILANASPDLASTGRYRKLLESLHKRLAQAGDDADARSRVVEALRINNADFRALMQPLPFQLADALLSELQLAEMEIAEPVRLIGPIAEGSLTLLYAARGTGKSLFTWEIALSVASGETLLNSGREWPPPRWGVSAPAPVLIVDGEMPLAELRKRAAFQRQGRDTRANLNFLAADQVWRKAGHGINLAVPDSIMQMDVVLEALPGLKLLVLDNLGSLFKGRTTDEDTKAGNEAIADWMVSLRGRGIAVVQVHHAGKSGEQRGSSYREDYQDTIIRLDAPAALAEGERAEFNVTFPKVRVRRGPDFDGFNARFDDGTWTFRSLEETRVDELVRIMRAVGKFDWKAIADELSVSKSRVYQLRKAAMSAGKWDVDWGGL
jgi:hypothetical protein